MKVPPALLVVIIVAKMATFTAECTTGPVAGLVDFDANLLHADLKEHTQAHVQRANAVGMNV